jgi:DNA-binding protein HU-beta
VNRNELVDVVAERLGDRRTAVTAVEAVLDTVTTTLAQGERVALFGFGVFERVERPARTARNPATGGAISLPARSVPRFRPGQGLKDAVAGGRPAARAELAPAPAAAPTGQDGATKAKADKGAAKAKGADKGKPAKGADKGKPAKDADKGKPAKSKGKSKKG